MSNTRETRFKLRSAAAGLMAATALMPAAAQAQESIETRLDRLEAMIVAMQERMDAQATAATDAQTVAELRNVLAETRAENRKLSEQQSETQARVAKVEAQTGDGFRVGGTTFTMGGYVKMDAKTMRTSGGTIPNQSAGRDFLIPSLIPVGGSSSGWDTGFHARQSRLIVKTSTPVGNSAVASHLELDFLTTSDGDQRVSNSYSPRMRQAFITYGGWTFGQAWSTFQNVGALPDSLDFVGTMPGTVFVRQPMIRYKTKSGISIAIENPETTITNAAGGRILPGDDKMPDVVARIDKAGFTVAGIVRQLTASDAVLPNGSDSTVGYGISASGKIAVGDKDDIRFMATAGKGLGRYLGANIVNDAAIDSAGNLKAIATYSGFAAYRHVWSSQLRSSIAGSYFKADNPTALTGSSPTDTVWNALANVIYSPSPNLDLGVEYMYAERKNEAGDSGNLQQVQISAKYGF